jgi:predicted ATP-binding protein involved in virulence
MSKIFVKKIKINHVRHLKNLEINLSETEKKHLIITGKNGSGKTSLIEEIRVYLVGLLNNNVLQIPQWEKDILKTERAIQQNEDQLKITSLESEIIRLKQYIEGLKQNIKTYKQNIANYSKITLSVNNVSDIRISYKEGNFIITFFESKRGIDFKKTSGIQKVGLSYTYPVQERANKDFIQYIVNLKAQRSFARDANDMQKVKDIDEWFSIFEDFLKEVFEDENLKLEFDSENFNFNIVIPNREKFDFNTLSDGYSAIMNIVTELILRMEKKSAKNYNIQGMVLIDEIETHLHIDLQKKILPFLTKIFPEIQFIVTTHSPFIINSLKNTVIYDLENHIQVEDLSGYSVEGIIEGYFNSDKYSELVKNQIGEYEKLVNKVKRTEKEQEKFKYFQKYFKDLSKFMAPELQLKIQQLEFKNLEKA